MFVRIMSVKVVAHNARNNKHEKENKRKTKTEESKIKNIVKLQFVKFLDCNILL